MRRVVLGCSRFADELRLDARPTLIDALQAAGRQVILLTGDAPAVAQRIAARLGIADVRAGVTPQGKHCVRELKPVGQWSQWLAMGWTITPVRPGPGVGCHGGGAQLARTQADFILLSENLDLRRGLLRGRRRTHHPPEPVVVLPCSLLLLAIAGFVTPWLAGIGMSASSLLVVLSTHRIQRLTDDGSISSTCSFHCRCFWFLSLPSSSGGRSRVASF